MRAILDKMIWIFDAGVTGFLIISTFLAVLIIGTWCVIWALVSSITN